MSLPRDFDVARERRRLEHQHVVAGRERPRVGAQPEIRPAPLVRRSLEHQRSLRGYVPTQRRHGVPRIEQVRDGPVVSGLRRTEDAVRVQVVGCWSRTRERPLLFVAPVPAHEDAALGRFVRIAAAHDVDPDGRLAVHSVVYALQPVIEPPQVKRREVERRVRGELRFAGVARVLTAMNPRSDDQPLQALLGPAQLDVIQVGDRSAPGVVPARGVVFRNVLVLRQVVHYAGAGVLPEGVVVAVAHRLDQPGFIIRGELERSRARTQRQAAHVIADVRSHVQRGQRRPRDPTPPALLPRIHSEFRRQHPA